MSVISNYSTVLCPSLFLTLGASLTAQGKASSTPAKRRFISDVPGVAATNGTEGVKVTHGGFDQPLTRTLDYDPAQEDAMV